MTKKMLIDAAHPEEVRVAVLDNGKVEDFDFESAARKPLRGNIYLARVTRVEPSLQAAFVEYGGNRHGFLAFSEIHPDYYQIPVSDRQALQAAEAAVAELAAELELTQRGDEDEYDHDHRGGYMEARRDVDRDDDRHSAASDADEEEREEEKRGADTVQDASDEDDLSDEIDDFSENEEEEEEEEDDEESEPSSEPKSAKQSDDAEDDSDEDDPEGFEETEESNEASSPDDEFAEDIAEDSEDIEETEDPSLSADRGDGAESEEDEADAGDERGERKERGKSAAAKRQALFERYKEAKRKRSHLLRNYKIQEVVKRRQILLIQVVKEERGNKGAALTTYLSLAGRYCVLMPNTARGGGISRKIPHSTDRRRLRRVVDSLDVPQGMGLIIRTAGAKRTKTEIKRDYDYLLRLWENIRTLTLKSIAPCLIYEEASLIKRAIRDLYDKDIAEVRVEGDAGYREAKDFMKMLMPSHAKHVQPYKEQTPIFLKYGVESQLDGMYQPTVRLKSGGYIVIHQTEALVAIDVNSGRATRERNIEQTALKTNVEAAYEAARQFRLRDLAGLIVLDFIDMEEPKNNRKVEKALKDALKHDRARIQTGRISNFGLLEMSRQRRRSGIVDGTTQSCPTCAGAGVIRSAEMAALRILRAVEGEAVTGRAGLLTVRTSIDVAVYILNYHRSWLKRIEDEQGVSVEIIPDREKAGDDYSLEKSGAPREREAAPVVQADQKDVIDVEEAEADVEAEEQPGERKKRRRRRRRKDAAREAEAEAAPSVDEESDEDEGRTEKRARDGDEEAPRKRRRRGRRGGRRNRRSRGDGAEASEGQSDEQPSVDEAAFSQAETSGDELQPPIEAAESGYADEPQSTPEERAAPESTEPELAEAEEQPKGNGSARGDRHDDAEETAEQTESAADDTSAPDDEDEDRAEAPQSSSPKTKRRGWWSRGSDA